MTAVLVLFKIPDDGLRYYAFDADQATLEDLEHADGLVVSVDDHHPFIEEFAEEFEEFEIDDSTVLDHADRRFFTFSMRGLQRIGAASSSGDDTVEMSDL